MRKSQTAIFPVLWLLLPLVAGPLLVNGQSNALTLFIAPQSAECGDTIDVPVQVREFGNVVNLDFSLTWDSQLLQRVGNVANLEPSMNLTPFNFGPVPLSPDNDTLTFVWFNAGGVTLPDDAALFTLRFVVLANGAVPGQLDFGNEYTIIGAGKRINNVITAVPVDTLNGVISIVDVLPPTLSCPADTTVIVFSPGAQTVGNIDPSASDNCGVADILFDLSGATTGSGQGSASGQLFEPGLTEVAYTAVDFLGNEVQCLFSVLVKDTIFQLRLPDLTVECDLDTLIVPVSVRNFNDMAALQTGIVWDASVLTFHELRQFHPTLGLSLSNFNVLTPQSDTLAFLWFNPIGVGLPDDAILFSIAFLPNGAPGLQQPVRFAHLPGLPIQAARTLGPPSIPFLIFVDTLNGGVIFEDTQDPTITCPDDLTVQIAPLANNAVVNGIDPAPVDPCGWDAVAYTISGATIAAGMDSASGLVFEEGLSTVVYTVTDFGGNTAACSFTVTLQKDGLILYLDALEADCNDTQAQVCVRSRFFEDLRSVQFSIDWDASVLAFTGVSAFHPNLTLNSSNFTDPSFVNDTLSFIWASPLGITVPADSALFCVDFDILGGFGAESPLRIISTASIPVQAALFIPVAPFFQLIGVEVEPDTFRIRDVVPPELDCSQLVDIEIVLAPNTCLVNGNWSQPSALDNCGGPVVVSGPAPDSLFAAGTQVITYVASDESGNTAACSFNLTVLDEEVPMIGQCPGDITVLLPVGQTDSVVQNLGIQATDNCGVQEISYLIEGALNANGTQDASGTNFVLGESLIIYTVSDASGNLTTCSFTVLLETNENGVDIRVDQLDLACDADEATLCVTVNGFEDILHVQFAVQWDPAELSFQSVTQLNALLNLNPSQFGPASGIQDTLEFMWNDILAQSLSDGDTLFCMVFEVLTDVVSTVHVVPMSSEGVPVEALQALPAPQAPELIPVTLSAGGLNLLDELAPELVCPDDLTVFLKPGETIAFVEDIAPVVTDQCGVPSVTFATSGATLLNGSDDASGQLFDYGITTVNYTAIDGGGNEVSCSFTVFLIDTLAPGPLELFVIAPRDLCNETEATICVSARDFTDLIDLQFALAWDAAAFELTGISAENPALNLSAANFGPAGGLPDTLTFEWADPQGLTLADDEVLFCLNFDVLTLVPQTANVLLVDFPGLPIQATVLLPAPQGPQPVLILTYPASVNIRDFEPPVITNCPASVVVASQPAACGNTFQWDDLVAVDNCTPDVPITCNIASGSIFELGVTTVECIAFDNEGFSDTCTFTVTIVDVQEPVVVCDYPPQILVSADDDCAAMVEWDPLIAVDNCTGPADLIFGGPVSGTSYPVGSHTIELTVSDEAGNIAVCSFEVFILDETPPVLTDCPDDLTISATEADCSVSLIPPSPLATDNCGDIFELTYRVATTFFAEDAEVNLPQGATLITWFAFDASANVASCSFTITVEGGGQPSLVCPDDITLTAAAPDCSILNLPWTDPEVLGSCEDPADLSLVNNLGTDPELAQGNTVVAYYLINLLTQDTLASCAFEVLVLETEAPVFINCPDVLTFTADQDNCGADADWPVPAAEDNCTPDNDLIITYNGPSSGFLSNGVYTATYTVTDQSGNTATCSFIISVCDADAPVAVDCPTADIVVTLPPDPDECTADVSWTIPTFTDECDEETALILTASATPGIFPAGTTTVVYTATDRCGNTGICTFQVIVLDQVAPTLTCPGDVTLQADGTIVADPNGFIDSVVLTPCREALVYYSLPEGVDNCSNTITQQQDNTGILSGEAVFPGGPYTLVFVVSDLSGNTATCTTNLTMLPGEPIVLLANPNPFCPDEDIQLTAEFFAGATYEWEGPDGFFANISNPVVPMAGPENAGMYNVQITLPGCPDPILGMVNVQMLTPPVLSNDNFSTLINQPLIGGNLLANDVLHPSVNASITFQAVPSVGTLTNNLDGTFDYTPGVGFTGLVEFMYEICYQECPELCATATVQITVELEQSNSCKPNNLISPNDDGRNDVLIIPCLLGTPIKFPNNSLTIYNQWGDQVYYAAPYNNNWKGTYQGNAGSPLPDGTYYYVFSKGTADEPVTGFITILR